MNYEHHMKQAIRLAEKALAAGEFPVGCVVVCDEQVIAQGMRQNSVGGAPNEMDHAEILALRQLSDLPACPDRRKMTVFATMEPCLMCFGALLVGGIRNIVFAFEDTMGGATSCDRSTLGPLYHRDPVTIVPGILRSESLSLFKAFFQNPENTYWKDSLLAEYTLKQ